MDHDSEDALDVVTLLMGKQEFALTHLQEQIRGNIGLSSFYDLSWDPLTRISADIVIDTAKKLSLHALKLRRRDLTYGPAAERAMVSIRRMSGRHANGGVDLRPISDALREAGIFCGGAPDGGMDCCTRFERIVHRACYLAAAGEDMRPLATQLK